MDEGIEWKWHIMHLEQIHWSRLSASIMTKSTENHKNAIRFERITIKLLNLHGMPYRTVYTL